MNWTKITEDDFHQALGAVPPAVHYHDGFLLGEPHDSRECRITGKDRNTFRAFAKIGDDFYKGDPLTVPEFNAERTKGFKVTRKYRVSLEASAAIMIEIEVDAEDVDDAETVGEQWLEANKAKVDDAVSDLLQDVDPNCLKAYAEKVGAPFTSIGVSAPDDEGFEVVDAFDPN